MIVPFVEGEPDFTAFNVKFCEGAGSSTDFFSRSTMTKGNKGIIMIR